MSGFLDPVGQVAHKVKEEVAVWHADDLKKKKKKHIITTLNFSSTLQRINLWYLICDLNKKAETLRRFKHQASRNVVAEVFGLGARLHFEHLRMQNGPT